MAFERTIKARAIALAFGIFSYLIDRLTSLLTQLELSS
jgi:hypothetical protein